MWSEEPRVVGNRDLCPQASWDIQQPPLAHHLEEALESWMGQKMLSKAQEGPGVSNAQRSIKRINPTKRRWDRGKKGTVMV